MGFIYESDERGRVIGKERVHAAGYILSPTYLIIDDVRNNHYSCLLQPVNLGRISVLQAQQQARGRLADFMLSQAVLFDAAQGGIKSVRRRLYRTTGDVAIPLIHRLDRSLEYGMSFANLSRDRTKVD